MDHSLILYQAPVDFCAFANRQDLDKARYVEVLRKPDDPVKASSFVLGDQNGSTPALSGHGRCRTDGQNTFF